MYNYMDFSARCVNEIMDGGWGRVGVKNFIADYKLSKKSCVLQLAREREGRTEAIKVVA